MAHVVAIHCFLEVSFFLVDRIHFLWPLLLGVNLCNSSLCCYYVTGCLKRQLSVLVQQISERRLIVESRNGRHYVHQTCLPANIIMWSRLFATKNSPPAGEVTKLVEDEKSETKCIEKKSLDIGTDASPVEKKPVTDKQALHVVVMEKKSLMTEEEQQSKKTSKLKEVVNKGIITDICEVGSSSY
jgi:hypothetical protein